MSAPTFRPQQFPDYLELPEPQDAGEAEPTVIADFIDEHVTGRLPEDEHRDVQREQRRVVELARHGAERVVIVELVGIDVPEDVAGCDRRIGGRHFVFVEPVVLDQVDLPRWIGKTRQHFDRAVVRARADAAFATEQID